jgi:hypothetical protein
VEHLSGVVKMAIGQSIVMPSFVTLLAREGQVMLQ